LATLPFSLTPRFKNLVPAKWRERLAISVNQKSFPDTESFDCQTKTSVLACLHMAIGL